MLAGLLLDVPRFAGEARAERVDALAVGLEQARHGILRQPVDLQVGMQLAQLAGDGDVAPAMAEADRRGEIERAFFAAAARLVRAAGRGDAKPPVEEVVDQRVALGGIAAERIVAAARDGDELAAGQLGHQLAARAWGWIWSSSPWIASTGQRILRYIASPTSKAAGSPAPPPS